MPTKRRAATAPSRNPSKTVKAKAATKRNGRVQARNGSTLRASDPHEWIKDEAFTTTADVPLPDLLMDEVLGQDDAVAVAKKAARQGRHLLLLGDPGTGKSMIAKAMAQILPERRLNDVLVYPNPKDANAPVAKTHKGGIGRQVMRDTGKKSRRMHLLKRIIEWTVASLLVLGSGLVYILAGGGSAYLMIIVLCVLVAIFFLYVASQRRGSPEKGIPNIIIEREGEVGDAPYVDATGSHAGALLGDIRHDPFQSGGLETPVHMRVEAGAIHRADHGILFIDEINVLRLDSQQALLTAMQEKKYAITGQSDKSAGAMSRTTPVPCDFILVAAGNMDVIAPTDNRFTGLHPALRSRIRGYGYEVYVRSVMDDTDENREKLVRFVAQEVRRDGQIPHFDRAAVAEVIREAQRRSAHTGKLTLRLRELGGLVRTAGDLARDDGRGVVTVDDVLKAKHMSMSLEYQVTRRGIEVSTAQEARSATGAGIGTVVGAAFMGTGETGEPAGIVVPVEADATVASDKSRGSLFLGGGLERDDNVRDNVAAVLKRLRGADISGIDVHVQALLEQRGADVTALGAPTALAAISALEDLPARRDTVVLGRLSTGGRLRGVDGITQMVEAAADLGYTRAVAPRANKGDILLEHAYRDRIEVILVDDLAEAATHVFTGGKRVAMVQNAFKRKV